MMTTAPVQQTIDLDGDFSTPVFLGFGALMRSVTKRWFRYEITGLDAIPDEPCMIVGNHSGVGVADVLCLFLAVALVVPIFRRYPPSASTVATESTP